MDRHVLHRQDEQRIALRGDQLDVSLVRAREDLLRLPPRRDAPSRRTNTDVAGRLDDREPLVPARVDAAGAARARVRALPRGGLGRAGHEGGLCRARRGVDGDPARGAHAAAAARGFQRRAAHVVGGEPGHDARRRPRVLPDGPLWHCDAAAVWRGPYGVPAPPGGDHEALRRLDALCVEHEAVCDLGDAAAGC